MGCRGRDLRLLRRSPRLSATFSCIAISPERRPIRPAFASVVDAEVAQRRTRPLHTVRSRLVVINRWRPFNGLASSCTVALVIPACHVVFSQVVKFGRPVAFVRDTARDLQMVAFSRLASSQHILAIRLSLPSRLLRLAPSL